MAALEQSLWSLFVLSHSLLFNERFAGCTIFAYSGKEAVFFHIV